jgi:hypothetical protein
MGQIQTNQSSNLMRLLGKWGDIEQLGSVILDERHPYNCDLFISFVQQLQTLAHLILVVLENLEDILGSKCIFPFPRRQSDDGIIDLILTQDLIMQPWMRVDRILHISFNLMTVMLTHPITWETAFLDDDLPPLLRRSVESGK